MDVITGGLISLLSVVGGIILQHFLSLNKQKVEARYNPARILYDKQIEFYDKLLKALPEVNGYITSIEVLLGESGPQAEKKAKEYAQRAGKIWRLHELIESYYIYLPNIVLENTNELFVECILISTDPSTKNTEKAMKMLFSLMNILRKCVGIDAITKDLFKAFYGSQANSLQTNVS